MAQYYPTYSKYVREKLPSGRVYALDPYGGYTPMSRKAFYKRYPKKATRAKMLAGGQLTTVGALPEYYQRQATAFYEPLYAPLEAQTTSYYDELARQLGERTRSEFQRRGILESGLYGEEFARTQRETETQRAAALAQVALQRTGAIGGEVQAMLGAGREAAETRLAQQQAQKQQQWKMFQQLLNLYT